MSDGFKMHQLALERVPFAIVITNPHIEDNPIVFVNSAFTRLTGYSPEVSVGRNCRFLQGKDTDPESVEKIRAGLKEKGEFAVELLNYKADGTPFRNRLFVSPLLDTEGELQYFIGLQRALGDGSSDQVTGGIDEALREIHHRVKNHLSMVVGMIRMQARSQNPTSLDNYTALARRIETLQFLYHEMTGSMQTGADDDIALSAYVSRIASAIAYLDGRESLQLNLDLGPMRAPVDTAARVGLLVSELLTNAYQHAFDGLAEGLIEVHLHGSDGMIDLVVEDNGLGLPADSAWPDRGNLGGKIVRSLVTGLNARLSIRDTGRGTRIEIRIPADVTLLDQAEPA
ncbi:PAS domain-containing protein [Acuticoccus yangtzensis]|uniref:PAS domain-containing protein n=1 Tax=Acuticoccus yangtzensis TaxID=1443441 RepID=UPI00094970D8|nr:PAS domain-containing protein [Acuticoccus yangtzensis]